MPIPSVRTIDQDEVRNFGKINAEYEISGLTLIQTASYSRFLQADRTSRDRLDIGLEAILREVFPIESYDAQFRLEYIRYELGKPRYTPAECRQLRLTYGMPFRVWLRSGERTAGRRRSLPGRHPDHDRWWRVHH